MSEQSTFTERHTPQDQLTIEELNALEGVYIGTDTICFERVKNSHYILDWHCIYSLSGALVFAPLFGSHPNSLLVYSLMSLGASIGVLFALWNHQREQSVIIDMHTKELIKKTQFLGIHWQSNWGKASAYTGLVLDERIYTESDSDLNMYRIHGQGILILIDPKGRRRELFRGPHYPQALNSIAQLLGERLGLIAFFGENGYHPDVKVDRYGRLEVNYVPTLSKVRAVAKAVLIITIYMIAGIILAYFSNGIE